MVLQEALFGTAEAENEIDRGERYSHISRTVRYHAGGSHYWDVPRDLGRELATPTGTGLSGKRVFLAGKT